MSRAVFAVVMYGSRSAVFDVVHCAARLFAVAACFDTSAALPGLGGSAAISPWSLVEPQLTGVLWPTPRGSKPITS